MLRFSSPDFRCLNMIPLLYWKHLLTELFQSVVDQTVWTLLRLKNLSSPQLFNWRCKHFVFRIEPYFFVSLSLIPNASHVRNRDNNILLFNFIWENIISWIFQYVYEIKIVLSILFSSHHITHLTYLTLSKNMLFHKNEFSK